MIPRSRRLPIVASNIDGFAGVLTHGVEGLLVRPEDSQAIADGIVALLRDPDRREQMADQGRKRAQYFRWDRVAQRVLSYYERLIYERRVVDGGRPPDSAVDAPRESLGV